MKRLFYALLICTLLTLPAVALVVTTHWAPDATLVPAAQLLISSGTSTVHIAANTLVDDRIVSSLATSASNGRSVVAVLNLSGGTARSIAAQRLLAAGVTVYSSNMPDLLENHLLTVDGGTCAIGNYYWSPSAQQIGSYLNIVPDPTLTASMDSHFAGLVSGGTLLVSSQKPARDTPPPLIQCYYSPNGGCQDKLCALIDQSLSSIRVLCYTDTNIGIFQALIRAHQRGVNVQIVADPYCAGLAGSQIPAAHAAGIPIRVDHSVKIMHEKVMIFDDKQLSFGSYNYSEPAEHANAEDMVVTADPPTIDAFVANWFVRYNASVAYGGPPAADVGGWQTSPPPPTPPGSPIDRSPSFTHVPLLTPDTRGTE